MPELFHPGGHAWFAALCLLAPWAAVFCERVRRSVGLLAAACALALVSPTAYFMLDRAILLGGIHGLEAGPTALAAAFTAAVATCLMPAVRAGPQGCCKSGPPVEEPDREFAAERRQGARCTVLDSSDEAGWMAWVPMYIGICPCATPAGGHG